MAGRGNRLDVIIPTRNRPGLTTEAIWAVQAQTFTDWHLFVVDDASEDSTASEVEKLSDQDPRITLLRRSSRGGGNPARQTGLEAGTAPLVAICDSDDLWETNKLRRQVDRWDQVKPLDASLAIVWCWHDSIDDHGDRIGAVHRPRFSRRWHPFTTFNTSTPLMSREALESVGGFAPSTPYRPRTTDFMDLFLRLTQSHTTTTTPELLVHCRHHGGARNSDEERTAEAADEATTLLRTVEMSFGQQASTRAWLHAWVAGRYLELGDLRRAKAFMVTALRLAPPTTAAHISAYYGPYALRQAARQVASRRFGT